MFKKSTSRNQRSKGIKIKHVLQVLLLLGVCFWLVYQVKRSLDKKKEFNENDATTSVKAQSDDVIVKFGRKDLPHVQEVSTNTKHEEEEEENVVEEENRHEEEQEENDKRIEEGEHGGISKHEEEELEDGSKHEEEQEKASKHEDEEEVREDEGIKHDDEEQEAKIKDEESEDGGKGDGDDEADGNELESADGKADHEEEFFDEEKKRETEGDDKENEGKENEEKEDQEESNISENDQSRDEGDMNAHEAREEHYKADDASSAVSHDTQINSKADKSDIENSNDNSTTVLKQETNGNTTGETNGDKNKSEVKVGDGTNSEAGSSLNVTYTIENDHEAGSSNSEHILLPNTIQTTESVDQINNNSTEVSKETGNKPGSLQNAASAQNTSEDGKVTEEKYKEQANETISYSDSNAEGLSKIETMDSATRDSLNSSINVEFGMSEDIAKTNATVGWDSSRSSVTKEIIDSTQNEKSEGDNESNGTDENTDASNETVDEVQHDPIDSSDNTLPQEEKDARVDLSTLPDITTEGSNHDDAAAE